MLDVSYFRQTSPVHRRDPRVKIIIVTILSILILHSNIPALLFLAGLVAMVSRLAGISHRTLLKSLRPAWPFLVGLLILYSFFTAYHPALSFRGGWQIDLCGFLFGLEQVSKFALLILAAAILTMTAPASDLAAALEQLLRPLRFIGISSSNLALMVSLAMRFIPTLMDETASIREAQLARGTDPNPRSLVKKVRYITGLAVPLAMNMLRRSDQLVDAMEARGFHPGHRSHLRRLTLDAWDQAVLVVCICGSIALWHYF